MARWTSTWLQGPDATLGEIRRGPDAWVGQRLGLPKEGSGSVASFSGRAFAFLLDAVACGLVAGLFFRPSANAGVLEGSWPSLVVLAVEHVLFVALMGQTLGMRLLGLKVVRLADVTRPPGIVTALLRTLPLVLTLGVAALFSRDGRGLHDLLAGCVVLRD